jgi:hypothetical protein
LTGPMKTSMEETTATYSSQLTVKLTSASFTSPSTDVVVQLKAWVTHSTIDWRR